MCFWEKHVFLKKEKKHVFLDKYLAGTQNHTKSRKITFHFSLRATRDWKSESVTYLLTYLQTWVGARDTWVSKKVHVSSTGVL